MIAYKVADLMETMPKVEGSCRFGMGSSSTNLIQSITRKEDGKFVVTGDGFVVTGDESLILSVTPVFTQKSFEEFADWKRQLLGEEEDGNS